MKYSQTTIGTDNIIKLFTLKNDSQDLIKLKISPVSREIVKRCASALKPGGELIIIDQNANLIPRSRRVGKFNSDGKLVSEYISVSMAARENGKSPGSMHTMCTRMEKGKKYICTDRKGFNYRFLN